MITKNALSKSQILAIAGATMQSGAGYRLYVVLLGGAVAAAGGLIVWRDFHQTSV